MLYRLSYRATSVVLFETLKKSFNLQFLFRTPYTTTVYATSPNLATSRAPVSATIVHSEETWTPAHENTQQSASAAAVSSTQPSLECVSERVSGAEDGSPTDIKNKSEWFFWKKFFDMFVFP